MILTNLCLSEREVAEKVGITIESCHIFIKKFVIQRLAAKLVPRLLTDDRKEYHINISQELLQHENAYKNIMKNSVTGDETRAYDYQMGNKR